MTNPAAPTPLSAPYGNATTWGTALDRAELQRHIASCRQKNKHAKGKALEQLAIWLFSHLHGVEVATSNVFSSDGAQEVDIALLCQPSHPEGFPTSETALLVECKNWSRPVDSTQVAWFDWKLRLGGLSEGILIAATGITGDPQRRSAAHAIIGAANSDINPRRMFILTLAEIEGICSRDDLIQLIKRKRVGLMTRDY